MKGYVGVVMSNHRSIKIAERCIDSGERFGLEIYDVPATTASIARREIEKFGLPTASWDESWSDPDAVLGNFVTQYRCWEMIRVSGSPGIVLEHDAVFVRAVPDLADKGDVINISKPSFSKFITKDEPGVHPFFSRTAMGYVGGAHGYYLTPTGAQRLMELAKEIGAGPCDLFLCLKNLPDLKELAPWCVEAHDSFSLIQKRKGCLAKHNFSEDFDHLPQ